MVRYYFASKLSSHNEDIDFNSNDFLAEVNGDLIGRYLNIASRTSGFISKHFDENLGSISGDSLALSNTLLEKQNSILDLYTRREFSKVVREIMNLADKVNVYTEVNNHSICQNYFFFYSCCNVKIINLRINPFKI